MAGDWIKLEHATIDKPEVARIAELLNVAPEYALGLVVRFWVWFDQNSRHGVVTPCHAKSVEAVMRCAGFMSVMQEVGWVSIDEKTHTLTIPNHDRHNTSPAKSRALANDRQKKHRNASVTVPSRLSHVEALPEKRREEVKIKNDVDVKGTVGAAINPQVKDFLEKVPIPKDQSIVPPEQARANLAKLREMLARPVLKAMPPLTADDNPTVAQIEARERERKRQQELLKGQP